MLQLPTIEELKKSKVNLVICSDKSEVERVMQLLRDGADGCAAT